MTRLLAIALAAALLAACGGDDRGSGLTVLAASSLTEALSEIEGAFERAHEGVDVSVSFGGSSSLAEQVRQGAPGDVLVTADRRTMATVDERGVETIVARNRLAIIVERGNPRSIAGLADLASEGTVVVLCAPEVPCGRLAALALERSSVDVTPASLEENVKGVVSKVMLGEADAGIVFATDAGAAAADVVDLGVADADLGAEYPMAVLDAARDRGLAEAWVAFVAGPEGQTILRAHGFLAP